MVPVRILFVDYQHAPKPDANGNCIQKLRMQLAAKGLSTDVLTFRLSRSLPLRQPDAYGTIYTADTWMRLGRIGTADGASLLRKAARSVYAVPVRLFHDLLGGPCIAEKYYIPLACRGLRRRLEQLCATEAYDWVVAVSGPFCIHETAAAADLGKARLALYYLDPYTQNAFLSAKRKPVRQREELAALAKATVIFASPEHKQGWLQAPFEAFLSKVCFLPYPNLFPAEESPESSIHKADCSFGDDNLHLVYLGSLQDGVRTPAALLRLFTAMTRLEPKLRLHIVGNKAGGEVLSALAAGQKELGEKLAQSLAVPLPQAMQLQRQADILVNLGNQMTNQMPSKLLDYIAAGKPILNLSPNHPCNTEEYLKQYPLALQCYEDELTTPEGLEQAARRALAFCREQRGKTLLWPEVRQAMAGLTGPEITECFLERLTNGLRG